MEAFQGKLHYFCSAFINAHWLRWQGLSIGAAVTSSLSFCDFSHSSSILVFILVLEPRATKSGAAQAWSLKPSCEPWFRTITWAGSRLCEPRLSPLDNGESENRLSLRWYHRKLERLSHTLAPCWVLTADPVWWSYSFALCLTVSLRHELVYVTKLEELCGELD